MIVQFGGQTPLNLALPLKQAGVKIIGTSPESIDLAEDRKRFEALLNKLEIPQSPGGMATSVDEALAAAEKVGYPVLVRPSYVLGGRAMVIAYDAKAVKEYMGQAVEYSQDRPILVDHFLEAATEVDVDALSDGEDVVIAGIMEHIEEAGIHSGDSSCVLPSVDLSPAGAGDNSRIHLQAGEGSERGGTDEHSVCDSARKGVRHRGESESLAHGAVCFQGDRRCRARRLRRG